MDRPAIDLSALRKALSVLTEALELWHAQPAGTARAEQVARDAGLFRADAQALLSALEAAL